MWSFESVFYQIYPLGFTGAPFENKGADYRGEEVEVVAVSPAIKSSPSVQAVSAPAKEPTLATAVDTQEFAKQAPKLSIEARLEAIEAALHLTKPSELAQQTPEYSPKVRTEIELRLDAVEAALHLTNPKEKPKAEEKLPVEALPEKVELGNALHDNVRPESLPVKKIRKSRIEKVEEWIPHIKGLGCNAIYFCPIFESDTHGYNTRDFKKLDLRLGTNEDFTNLCKTLHKNGIKVVLDGVFNHVGRGFWAFQDVLKHRGASPYANWFYINFQGNSYYNDGLWYEGWEGNYDLVKLNLGNEEVIQHILDCVSFWVEEFDIDGLRLDVAYLLSEDFLRRLRKHCDSLKDEFFLLGEFIYEGKQVLNDEMLDSITNYECYKGLYSSFNSMNLFEICHSLQRLFGSDPWTLYRGKHLLSFVDNHDVTRVASILKNEKHLPLIYAMCFGMPGIPIVYYGSEWGAKADKSQGDPALRLSFDKPIENELTEWISKLAEAKKNSKALNYGEYKVLVLTNKQCIFERKFEDDRVLVAINADAEHYTANFDAGCGRAEDLITGEPHDFGGGSNLPPYSAYFWKTER